MTRPSFAGDATGEPVQMPNHAAEYEPRIHPAAGPWEEGEPGEYKCYLVEVAVKGAKGRENPDVTVVRYDRYAGWQVDEWHTEVLRHAEIYSDYA